MGVQGVGVWVEVEMEEVETVGVEEGWEVKFSSVNTSIHHKPISRDGDSL